MAIAFDASSQGNAASVNGITVTHTVGAGSNRALYVGIFVHNGDNPTAITYNSVAMTQIQVPVGFAADTCGLSLWRLVAPSSGTHDIVATCNANDQIFLVANSYTGVHQTVPDGTPVTATGDAGDSTGNGPVAVTLAGIVAGSMVMDCGAAVSANIKPTVDASQTKRAETFDGVSTGSWLGSSEKSSSGSVTMQWTLNQTPKYWASVGVEIKADTATALSRPMFRGH